MKKIALVVAGVLGLGIVGIAAAASMQPDDIHVERSITVNATPTDMQPFAADLEKVNEWSPWDDRDPEMTKTYSDPTAGVGATYEWKGNQEVGHGIQTIKSVDETKVVQELEFFEPFETVAEATIAWTQAGDELTVTWSYDQKADFSSKVMTLFMDMDAMLGPDYEDGLDMLKPLVEKAANERRAAAKKAAAEEAEAKAKAEAEEAAAAQAAEAAAAEAAGGGEPAAQGSADPA